MNKQLTLGSLFDGSGGFPLGAIFSGIQPIWASEIELFPIRVTTKRFPQMVHYGDISAMNGAEIEPVDIITFGSPCTNLSVAGKREGLDGKQSSLFYQAIRIVKEMRQATHGKYPRYIVWENVPGAFSSNGSEDFRSVLESIVQIAEPEATVPAAPEKGWPYADVLLGDGWSLAYRTVDAQYFGVAQRRKRIYLVADFASERAGEILFEREGVSRNFEPGFSPGQGAAGGLEGSTGEPIRVLNDQGGACMSVTDDCTATLRAQEHGHQPIVFEPCAASRLGGHIWIDSTGALRADAGDNRPAVALENHPADGRLKINDDGKVQTLTSRMGTGGMNVPLTLKVRSGCEGGGKGQILQRDMSATLSTVNDQSVFVPTAAAFMGGQGADAGSIAYNEHIAPTIRGQAGGNSVPMVMTAYGICSQASNSMKSSNPHSGVYEMETSRTLDTGACSGNGGQVVVSVQGSMIGRKEKNGPQGSGINENTAFTLNTADRHAVAYAMTTGSFTEIHEEQSATLMARDYKDPQVVNASRYLVRRLTPLECCRLQSFPDGWCSDLETLNPTEEEITWWAEVFETHRKIMGTSGKPRSRKQIAKWLQNPHSDSAEYKMWGNGLSVQCAIFVLRGIVESTQLEALISP